MVNDAFGWMWMLMGVLSGAWIGMSFHKEHFLGGYGSWPRRLVRLGHIAFFGTGMLNIAFASTVMRHGFTGDSIRVASWVMIVGAALMPICCFITARWKLLVPIFVLPVVGLGVGIGLLAWRLVGGIGGVL